MKTVSYYSLTGNQRQDFLSYLSTVTDSSPAFENMWDADWTNKPNTLPYILERTDKFQSPHGDYFIIYDDLQPVGMGGIYFSSFNRFIALAGVRTWVNPAYRNRALLKENLLPYHKAWAVKNNCRQVALTFNEYNKNIVEIFKRNRAGTPRLEHNLFYNGLVELGFPVVIQKTPQWVIYEPLDQDWKFNWEMIQAQ